jgi:solute carrier family 35, member C2
MTTPSSPPTPHHRHSLTDSINTPTTTLSFDDASILEHSDRARFSLDNDSNLLDDIHNDNNPSLYGPPSTTDRPLLRRILRILLLILLWYTFSLLLSMYNKWMFAPGHLNFPFPLFVTSVHMLMQFFLSWFVLWWFPKFRPQRKDYLSIKEYT